MLWLTLPLRAAGLLWFALHQCEGGGTLYSPFMTPPLLHSGAHFSRPTERYRVMERLSFVEESEEARRLDLLTNLSATLQIMEMLEDSYLNGAVTSERYTDTYKRLSAAYDMAKKAAMDTGALVSVEDFIKEYKLNFPYAYRRLETERVSAASKVGTEATLNAQRAVFKVSGAMITFLDAMQLDTRDVEYVRPDLLQIVTALNDCGWLPSDWPYKLRMLEWCRRLEGMSAIEKIDDSMVSEMSALMREALNAFEGSFQSAL